MGKKVVYEPEMSAHDMNVVESAHNLFRKLICKRLSVDLKLSGSYDFQKDPLPKGKRLYIIQFAGLNLYIAKPSIIIYDGKLSIAGLTENIKDSYVYCEDDIPYIKRLCDNTGSNVIKVDRELTPISISYIGKVPLNRFTPQETTITL